MAGRNYRNVEEYKHCDFYDSMGNGAGQQAEPVGSVQRVQALTDLRISF